MATAAKKPARATSQRMVARLCDQEAVAAASQGPIRAAGTTETTSTAADASTEPVRVYINQVSASRAAQSPASEMTEEDNRNR